MQMYEIYLFGSPRIEIGGVRVDLGLRKSTALLAFLALSKQPFDRDSLATLFWPEVGHSAALGNLRRALYRINHALQGEFVLSTRKTIERNPDFPIWIDVEEFLQSASSKDSLTAAQLEQAADLYTADFLAGFSLPDTPAFDEWQFFQGESLRRSQGALLEHLASTYAAQADWERAVLYCRQWAALDRLDETPQRQLMELFCQMDQIPAALRQYDDLQQHLRDELGLEPNPETTALYETIRARQLSRPVSLISGDPAALPGPGILKKVQPGPFHNLPAQSSIFIGRKPELEGVLDFLSDESGCRLLTIVGPGGIGKTRLALEAAYGALRSFADGVCFVSLASLTSPEHIVATLIENLGLRFYDDQLAQKYLLNYLREKHLLLVMDNVEHLLPYIDLITNILQVAPEVKILATSRDRLNLTGEMVFSLGAMGYPEKDDFSEIQSHSAVQLLIHYARLARPDLVLDQQALEGIGQICRLVQGMPLALVLAAGWAEALTFMEIANEIAQNLDFLESQALDVPERQRSVRAAFEYSWKRLSAEDQLAFASLSVFHGGFTRQAAEQIAGARLRTLRNLIDRSFISMRQNGQYDIHELLRQFGEEYLVISGNADPVQEQHSRYYLALLADLEKHIKGSNQFEALDQIETEYENIRSAWEWALSHRADGAIDQVVESLYLYFSFRSRYLEGAEFFGNAHELFTPRPHEDPPRVCGRVLARYVWLLALHRKPDSKTDGYIEHCMELAVRASDQHDIAFTNLLLGCYHLMSKNDPQAALAYLETSYDLYLSLDDPFYIAIALLWLGSCHGDATGADRMMEFSGKSLELARATGNTALLPFALRNLARGAIYSGDYTVAEQYNQEAMIYQERMGLRMGLAEAKITLSLIRFLRGDLDEARQYAAEGLQIGREIHFMWSISDGLAMLSLYEAVCGDADACKALVEESLAIPSSLSGNMVVHWSLAIAMCEMEQYDQAWQQVNEALLLAARLSSHAGQVWPLPVAVYLLAKTGCETDAVELLSFVKSHSLNPIGWTAAWKRFEVLTAYLKSCIEPEIYAALWQQGKNKKLEDVLSQLSSVRQ